MWNVMLNVRAVQALVALLSSLSLIAAVALCAPSAWADDYPLSFQAHAQPQRPTKAAAPTRESAEPFTYFNHGFRVGYMTIMNHDCALITHEPSSCQDIKRERGLITPHTMFVGYELTQRLRGSDSLNVIFVENILFAGLEQSALLPSFNALVGFEFVDEFQVLIGANLIPSADKTAHMIATAGWTPSVGAFQVPVHFFFIPDVDAQHRLGVSLGVNW